MSYHIIEIIVEGKDRDEAIVGFGAYDWHEVLTDHFDEMSEEFFRPYIGKGFDVYHYRSDELADELCSDDIFYSGTFKEKLFITW